MQVEPEGQEIDNEKSPVGERDPFNMNPFFANMPNNFNFESNHFYTQT